MFNLKGPQGQNPRTTVWETLVYDKNHMHAVLWIV